MNTRNIAKETWQQIDRLVAGQCSEDDVRTLEQSLGGNQTAQREMLEYCQLHLDLLIDVRAEVASKPLLDQMAQSSAPAPLLPSAVAELHSSIATEAANPLRIIGITVSAWQIAAFGGFIAILLLLTLPFVVHRNSIGPASEEAVIQKALPLAGQSFQLDSGTAKLSLPGIGYVVLEGPVDFDLISEKRARLKTGRIKMRVTDVAGRGFVVETPDGEITDLGTEFGVEVVNGRETGLVVFEGSVDLRVAEGSASQAAHVARLVEGEGALFNKGGPLTRINSIVTGSVATFVNNNGQHLESRLPPAPDSQPTQLIAKVTDNLRSTETKKFYEIVPGGLREDAKAYADSKHEWNGITAEGIPKYLVGADYVKTFNQFSVQKEQKLSISVTLAHPAKLYVFFDARSEPPAWLTQDFHNTGDRIGLDASFNRRFPHRKIHVGPGEGIDEQFTIWEREVHEPGMIRLGPNLGDVIIDPTPAMYGIAAAPIAASELPPKQDANN